MKKKHSKPKALLDPTPLLLAAARGLGRTFDLDFYDGTHFRDPAAEVVIKYEYGRRLNRP